MEAAQPEKGLEFLRQAQPGPKADRLPDLQFNLGLAHDSLGQSEEAAACFLQAAQLYRSQGDGGSEGDACMEMSRCYSRAQVRNQDQGRMARWNRWRLGSKKDKVRYQVHQVTAAGVWMCCRTGSWLFRVSCELQRVTDWQPCWILQHMRTKKQEVT